MKKLIFFVLFVLTAKVTSSQNLVVNPGFETWTSSNPDGWSISENCTKETGIRYSGDISCMQSATSQTRNLSQRINVLAGKDYSLSLYYITGSQSQGNGCRIWCKWFNSDNIEINDPVSKELMESGFLKSNTWKQFSITVKAPPSAVTFFLQVRTLSNSITYWDDFVFEEGVPTGVHEEPGCDIRIYPVPADNQLILSNTQGITKIEIIDFTGTVLKSEPASGQDEMIVQISDLKPSIYLVRLHYGTGTVTRRFVKK